MTEEVKQGATVTIHYTGTLEDGTVFDSSEGRDPLQFKVGEGQVIRGFENIVLGMKEGEKKKDTIPSDDAYGEPRDELVLEVPKDQFPEDMNPEPGMQVAVMAQNGQQVPAMVKDVKDESVTLDANHPLAGKDLTFEVELVKVESS